MADGGGAGGPVTDSGFLEPDAWLASLPELVITASAVITDPAGRVLLVKPNYRDRWSLPGGISSSASRRIWVADGRWPRKSGSTGRPDGSGHRLVPAVRRAGAADDAPAVRRWPGRARHRIVLQESELDDYRFTAADELADYLPSRGLARLEYGLLRPLRSACRSTFLTKFSERGSILGRPGWRPRGCGSRRGRRPGAAGRARSRR